MSDNTNLIDDLIKAFGCLAGVGPKSAQRMTYQLLERNRKEGSVLGETLVRAMQDIKNCQHCRNFTEHDTCHICSNSGRNHRQICIVESPADVLAIESSASYRGIYFVLMGHLSPLDGIGPEELGLDSLAQRIQDADFDELILATNPTVEGEATAHYISDLCRDQTLDVTRIAHGVPLGGELEYVDGSTLAHSFTGRQKFNQ